MVVVAIIRAVIGAVKSLPRQVTQCYVTASVYSHQPQEPLAGATVVVNNQQ